MKVVVFLLVMELVLLLVKDLVIIVVQDLLMQYIAALNVIMAVITLAKENVEIPVKVNVLLVLALVAMCVHLAHTDAVLLAKVHARDNVILPVAEVVRMVVRQHVIIHVLEPVMYLVYL